jgi:DNA-binding transcriptional LysR family regulator
MDRLSAMVVFARVVEAASFSEAARRLGLSKSAVSKQVTALEERLAAQLLHRTTRKLSLTEAGRSFYERCTQIVRAVEDAERAVSHVQSAPRGILRVNAPVSFGQLALAPALPAFLSQHPELRVELVLEDRRVDAIEAGFDVTIRVARRLVDSSLISRRIASTRIVVCAAPEYLARRGVPETPDALAVHACLLYAYRQPWHFRGRSLEVAGPLLANNGDALREAALAGLGLVQLPAFIVAAELASGALCAVLEPFEARDAAIWALYSPTRHLAGKVRAFVDFLGVGFGGDGTRRGAAPGSRAAPPVRRRRGPARGAG